MFDLELAWDRPAKPNNQQTNHVLRVRISPETGANLSSLPLRMTIALNTKKPKIIC